MAEMNKTIRAAWLFPDILYIHGERGNLLALQRVAKFGGIQVIVDRVDFDTEGFNPLNYDFIFCPPGEISSFPEVIEWLKPHKAALDQFVEEGRVLLVTGTSQCIFGGVTKREDGSMVEGLGLIGCDFTERKLVYGDDLYFMTGYGCGADEEPMEIFGSQIQMMDVESREEPFGILNYGYGNTGKDRNEGAMKKNAIFTNTLGPILELNPWLTKKIVQICLKNAGCEDDDFEFDMSLEQKSLETKKQFTAGKASRLTNCK